MNERWIAQSLQEQARKDIPDDMNLIPEVYERLGRATRTAARSRLSWIAAAVLAMLAIGVVAYAAARLLQDSPRDPGLEGASEADLVTELNMEQTIEGVTITLEYAYADSNRISIGYRMSGTAPMGTGYQDVGHTLTDSAGNEYQTMFGGGGGGGSGDIPDPQNIPFSGFTTASFDVPPMDDVPDDLALRLEINVNRVISARLDDASTPQPVEGAPITEPLEPFVFEFTVPFIAGQVVEPQQSATANDITLTLNRLVIAPSLTRGDICFDPLPDTDYAPVISLTIDGEAVPIDPQQGFLRPPEGSPENCYNLQFNISLYNRPGEWVLSIDSLARYLYVSVGSSGNETTANYTISGAPEALAIVREKLEPRLQEQGIELNETSEGLTFSFDVTGDANGMRRREIDQIVQASVREETPGPWVFTFDVPPVG